MTPLSRPRATRRGALALACAALVLGGCASMSPDECRTADWHERGLRDGQDGEPLSQLNEHIEACAKAGIVPDAQAYRQGHAIGIERFCTPQNAADYGTRGRYYSHGTCPASLEAAFEQRYRQGREVYDARQRLDNLLSRQRDFERKLDRAKNDDERASARRDLRRLDSDLEDARSRLRRAESRLGT